MGVTIRDVAELVGVSAASVSLVLNYKECRISEETKQKIFDGARELGYEPKRGKRGNSAYDGKVIGVICPRPDDELTDECTRGIENYASVYGYHTFYMFCADRAEKCAEQIELAASLGAAGVIIQPPSDMNKDGNNIMLGDVLKKSGIPYVLLDKAIHNVFCDFVTADNKLGANMAVDHLVAAGHRKIGIATGRKEIYNTRKQVEGYREGMILKGLEVDESLICYGDYSVEDGEKAAQRLLESGATAMIACDKELTMGICEYARKRGEKVGEDFSLVSFANMREADYLEPKITSICQPGEQMGRKAAEVLVGRICHENLESVKTNYFTPALVQGDSVKNR